VAADDSRRKLLAFSEMPARRQMLRKVLEFAAPSEKTARPEGPRRRISEVPENSPAIDGWVPMSQKTNQVPLGTKEIQSIILSKNPSSCLLVLVVHVRLH
jgi:hypothetical protein